MKTPLHGLYAITPQYDETQTLLAAVEQAILGGATIVQYRDKSTNSRRRLEQAGALATLCRRYHTLFLVNDDIELALACDAQGVHLGRNDQSLAAARRRLGADAIIGASCYNRLTLALQAQDQGANYVAFGSFFPSAVKPDAVRAELRLLAEAKRRLTVPVAAIGGILPQNAAPLITHGADMLAVISGLFDQHDIKSSAQAFCALFNPEE